MQIQITLSPHHMRKMKFTQPVCLYPQTMGFSLLNTAGPMISILKGLYSSKKEATPSSHRAYIFFIYGQVGNTEKCCGSFWRMRQYAGVGISWKNVIMEIRIESDGQGGSWLVNRSEKAILGKEYNSAIARTELIIKAEGRSSSNGEMISYSGRSIECQAYKAGCCKVAMVKFLHCWTNISSWRTLGLTRKIWASWNWAWGYWQFGKANLQTAKIIWPWGKMWPWIVA